MASSSPFSGHQGTYELPTETALPHAVGRASLIYKGTGSDGRSVCIKVYTDPRERFGPIPLGLLRKRQGSDSGFDHELRAYRELEHPNILPLIDYGREQTSNALFLVLPWCEGGDLREAMSRRQFFPLSDAVPILRSVASALDYAHSQGFVHGDVKPENILFAGESNRPFLSDFGSARRTPYVERFTPPGIELMGPGTTAYLSPEQILGDLTTPRSDIYALATVAFEMLTGRLPIETAVAPYKQMRAKTVGEVVPARKANPALPAHAEDALLAALSVDPAFRPETAQSFVKMLSGEVRVPSLRRQATPEAARRRPLTRAQRLALLTTIITVLGAIIVAAVNIIPSLRGHDVPRDSVSKHK